jgi:hypothetical protein
MYHTIPYSPYYCTDDTVVPPYCTTLQREGSATKKAPDSHSLLHTVGPSSSVKWCYTYVNATRIVSYPIFSVASSLFWQFHHELLHIPLCIHVSSKFVASSALIQRQSLHVGAIIYMTSKSRRRTICFSFLLTIEIFISKSPTHILLVSIAKQK